MRSSSPSVTARPVIFVVLVSLVYYGILFRFCVLAAAVVVYLVWCHVPHNESLH